MVGAKQLGWGVSKGVPPRYYDSEKSMYVKKNLDSIQNCAINSRGNAILRIPDVGTQKKNRKSKNCVNRDYLVVLKREKSRIEL